MSKVLVFFLCVLAAANSVDWWERSTLYQIYPRTFKDSNNDGLGDLKGIISKLEYFKEIGLTAVWLSPIFKSPQVDAGYDISDYRDIDPTYGTLDDLKELVDKAHELGLKVIMDFVPNHTSDLHEWFVKSVNGDPEYEDFFIWRKGKNNNTEPPNNWISIFPGPAWSYVKERDLWYYHLFTAAQPDLNFRNPKVIEALNDVMIYWLDFGIDGFRVDAAPYLVEDENLTDEPNFFVRKYTANQNETYDVIYLWRDLLDKYNKEHEGDTRIMMTEAYASLELIFKYYGSPDGERLGAHFGFNFDFVNLNERTTANDIKKKIDRWLTNLAPQYTHNWVAGNHDNHRVATRLGKDNADAINMLQAILPGVMVNYNGEEYAMENGPVTCEQGHDPQAISDCTTYDKNSRDVERTPMQWDNTTNAGFNEGAEPWLPVNPDYIYNNIKDQDQPGIVSHLNIYKSLQEMRKNIPADALTATTVFSDTILGITRYLQNGYYLYLYNRLGAPTVIELNGESRIIVSSSISDKPEGTMVSGKIILDTNECIILWQGIPA